MSAKKAGYASTSARKTANRLLTNKYIQKYISLHQRHMENHAIANAKEIYTFYTAVLRGKITEPYEIGTTDGVYTGERAPSVSDRLTACHELLKRYAPIEKAKAKKLSAEATIKSYEASHVDDSQNTAMSKVDKLLNVIFEDGKDDNEDTPRGDNQ